MAKMNIKTGDKVCIIAGKDKNKTGKVLACDPKSNKIKVEGVNVVHRHTKPRAVGQAGGIISNEQPFNACKAIVVCPKCGAKTRVARRRIADGTGVRLCKKCGEEL
ncbi:MAG: 50S ribosomal protein L24 [Clostridiales bacterium]|jgi:large subunit ribosomal protein L24|nr:50S ribosomal protein L24 [Clostridiales bacterium]